MRLLSAEGGGTAANPTENKEGGPADVHSTQSCGGNTLRLLDTLLLAVFEMDSDSSDYVVGHHEEWDDVPGQDSQQTESQESPINSLRTELKRTKELLKHMEWHCHAYRMALQKVPGGLKALHDAHQVMESATSPPCNACERDSMLQRIQDLEDSQKGSPIFRSTSVRKRREELKEKQQ